MKEFLGVKDFVRLLPQSLANLKSLIWPGWRILKIPETSTVDFFNIDLIEIVNNLYLKS